MVGCTFAVMVVQGRYNHLSVTTYSGIGLSAELLTMLVMYGMQCASALV